MIQQTVSLVGSMWAAIGPGLVLAAALPLLVIALVVITRTGMRKTRRAGESA